MMVLDLAASVPSNIHPKCRKVADPRDGSQHTSSKDKTAQSPEDPQSVHLIDLFDNDPPADAFT
ncbi:hypothetical protein GBA52_000469 [Prunus armeniaca]|nr:hypothetical protein GBA52_000469 [Prunus armeniaca]